jgi:hypothetical protein
MTSHVSERIIANALTDAGLVPICLRAVSGAPASQTCLSSTSFCGRFGYSDLKEAALSGAAALWALNAGVLLLEGCEP